VRFTSGLSLLPFLLAFGMVATGSWLKTLAAKATVTTHLPTMWDLPRSRQSLRPCLERFQLMY
jgi:hypothetical protein